MARLAVVLLTHWLSLYGGHAPHVLQPHAGHDAAMDATAPARVAPAGDVGLAEAEHAAHCAVEAVVRPARGGTAVLVPAATTGPIAVGPLIGGGAACRSSGGRARPPPARAFLQVYLF